MADLLLLADAPGDLRAQLAEAQRFADESSFQFSKDKSQVVVFGGPDEGDDFFITGTKMKVVEEYTYLGVVFHQSLGRIDGSRPDRREKYKGMRFFDGDDGVEEDRIVDHVYDDETEGWMAHTLRLGAEDDETSRARTGSNPRRTKRI